jgi:hypothetical protein
MATLGLVLLAAAVVGVLALAIMLGLTVWHVRRPGLVPTTWPGISVLKPLQGRRRAGGEPRLLRRAALRR